MIVYFSQNSKKLYLGWVIGGLIFIIGLYMSFVWSRIQLLKGTTLQIIRTPVLMLPESAIKDVPKPHFSPEVQKAFVASKRGKYYYPTNCTKAKTLSVNNTLYFKDKMSAEGAGFKAYLGCK
jgi:hypothetical protein